MKTEQFNTGKALTSIAGTILFYFFLCVCATQVHHPLFPRFRRLTLSLSAITLSDLNADISDSGSNNTTKFLDFTSYDLRFHSRTAIKVTLWKTPDRHSEWLWCWQFKLKYQQCLSFRPSVLPSSPPAQPHSVLLFFDNWQDVKGPSWHL